MHRWFQRYVFTPEALGMAGPKPADAVPRPRDDLGQEPGQASSVATVYRILAEDTDSTKDS